MSLEEFLQSAREGELEIERMSDMLLRLDARAKRGDGGLSPVRRHKGRRAGGDLDAAGRAAEKLTQRMTEAAKQQEAVEAFLAKIGRSRYREMLRLRFLSYLTIEEASARMGYSYDAGKRLSAQAMRAARAIWEGLPCGAVNGRCRRRSAAIAGAAAARSTWVNSASG